MMKLLADPSPITRKLLPPCSHQNTQRVYPASTFPFWMPGMKQPALSHYQVICCTCRQLVYVVWRYSVYTDVHTVNWKGE